MASPRQVATFVVLLACSSLTGAALAQGKSVINTVHNLSVSGPGEIRSESEKQVCKFCHVPHNANVPVPLWGHSVTQAQFLVPEIQSTGKARVQAPQPDGSSRLCLSCHDGTVALGDVAGNQRDIVLPGSGTLGPGRPGFLGTDLSGSHPISFVLSDEQAKGLEQSERDLLLLPVETIKLDRDVKLDPAGKMQCTTCHDPHSDANYQEGKVPRFWVKTSVDEVCLACHSLR